MLLCLSVTINKHCDSVYDMSLNIPLESNVGDQKIISFQSHVTKKNKTAKYKKLTIL